MTTGRESLRHIETA